MLNSYVYAGTVNSLRSPGVPKLAKVMIFFQFLSNSVGIFPSCYTIHILFHLLTGIFPTILIICISGEFRDLDMLP